MLSKSASHSISEVTRRAVFDGLRLLGTRWSGRLEEDAFLTRLFDLNSMHSNDHRFSTAAGDIHQHRSNNRDWQDDWVFDDSRFDLLRCADEVFLRFICEMVHPVVRPDADEAAELVRFLNENLAADGWEIAARSEISGRTIYAARRLIEGAGFAIRQAATVGAALGAEYVSQQITRMEAAVQNDPELAIGTAKEFLETICKTILKDAGVVPPNDELPALLRTALDQLKLNLRGAPDVPRAEKAVQRLLGNLSGIGSSVGEVRNALGSGHGKEASNAVVDAWFARLVVGSATTIGVFLFEAYFARKANLGGSP
ncbi:MAG: abortive infection family protein [Phycisphaerae bacterium]|nr:abortive infection family protein [Phycisphaerae bacterium]